LGLPNLEVGFPIEIGCVNTTGTGGVPGLQDTNVSREGFILRNHDEITDFEFMPCYICPHLLFPHFHQSIVDFLVHAIAAIILNGFFQHGNRQNKDQGQYTDNGWFGGDWSCRNDGDEEKIQIGFLVELLKQVLEWKSQKMVLCCAHIIGGKCVFPTALYDGAMATDMV
jgi:hypothetical protein